MPFSSSISRPRSPVAVRLSNLSWPLSIWLAQSVPRLPPIGERGCKKVATSTSPYSRLAMLSMHWLTPSIRGTSSTATQSWHGFSKTVSAELAEPWWLPTSARRSVFMRTRWTPSSTPTGPRVSGQTWRKESSSGKCTSVDTRRSLRTRNGKFQVSKLKYMNSAAQHLSRREIKRRWIRSGIHYSKCCLISAESRGIKAIRVWTDS